MAPDLDQSWILEALRLTAGEPSTEVMWNEKDGRITLFMLCSDTFWWGSADCEEVTAATLPVLASARADLETVGDYGNDLAALYAARIRKMRPQGAAYKYIDEAIRPLFDACGPHRGASLGNPVATPAP